MVARYARLGAHCLGHGSVPARVTSRLTRRRQGSTDMLAAGRDGHLQGSDVKPTQWLRCNQSFGRRHRRKVNSVRRAALAITTHRAVSTNIFHENVHGNSSTALLMLPFANVKTRNQDDPVRHLDGAGRVLLHERGLPGHAGAVGALEGAAGVAAVRRAVARQQLLGRQQAPCGTSWRARSPGSHVQRYRSAGSMAAHAMAKCSAW